MKSVVICLVISMATMVAAAAPNKLENVLMSYKKSSGITMNVLKVVKSELLEKETNYQGTMTLSKGKLYWMNETPDKNLLVFDGSTLWNVQYPPKEFDSNPQIAKTKIAGGGKNQHVLIVLLNGKSVRDKFDIKQDESEKGKVVFNLKEKKSELNIKNIKIHLDEKAEKITTLEYADEVDNKTVINFSSVKFNQKIQSSLFDYKPPKGVPVTEY